MRSKRQQQIVQMVQGYDSTFTVSVALRNVFLAWILYGLALVVFGLFAFVSDPLSGSAETTERTMTALRAGSFPLFVFTFIVCTSWVMRSVANVHRLGRKANIGVLARFKRHIMAMFFGFVSILFAAFVPPLALVFVVVAVALLFYSQLWFHLLLLDLVRMLWSTSSPPNGQHEDVDHYVLIWFWSWVGFISLLVVDASTADISMRTLHGLTIIAGGACIAAALLASRLVVEISKRQDARLFAIIHEVEDDQAAKPVTDQDIAAAWSRSAGMIDMPH